jgi:hypothetical protein
MAAGQGFKTFTTGEVLTAGDVNGYLMQGVLVFASAAARNAAITSPQEGQFAFTKDTNGLWYYDGAAWVASGATGDIEGVTAGVGISGGGTSGTVTITNSMATAIDAKGDLVAGTGADTFAKLTVGANGTTLVADSAEATGLKWAAPAGGGKVLQVIQATSTTSTTTTSTSFSDTTLTASITPSSATSKVLIIFTQSMFIDSLTGSAESGMAIKLLRASTDIVTLSPEVFRIFNYYAGSRVDTQLSAIQSYTHLDSPSTTSATTYKTQFRSTQSGKTVGANYSSCPSSIVLMEIGA